MQHSLKRVCQKQGYLLKRGRRYRTWKRRYFCICGSVLYYYYTAEISNPFRPLGVVPLVENDKGEAHLSSNENVEALHLSSVMVQPDPVDSDLPSHYVFAIHTRERKWHLAADSSFERSEWLRVLCEGGAQLSASSAQLPDPDPLNSAVSGRGGEGAAGSGAEMDAVAGDLVERSVVGLDGVLWKRASKVHITQVSETETGQARLPHRTTVRCPVMERPHYP